MQQHQQTLLFHNSASMPQYSQNRTAPTAKYSTFFDLEGFALFRLWLTRSKTSQTLLFQNSASIVKTALPTEKKKHSMLSGILKGSLFSSLG